MNLQRGRCPVVLDVRRLFFAVKRAGLQHRVTLVVTQPSYAL